MTWFDYAVIAILGLSVLLAAYRGVVREITALAGWAAALILSTLFAQELAQLLPASLSHLLRVIIAYVVIFLGALLLSGLIGMVLAKLFHAAGLGFTDRAVGALFGLLRGAVIVFVGVMFAGLTELPKEPFWREAALSGPVETVVLAAKPALPKDLAQRIRYR
ncbi:MAG: CvpA family protein [Betaproteobacteria bacterium]|nr:MAG: CvpA family protein [Betaproteobacteria bacterium]